MRAGVLVLLTVVPYGCTDEWAEQQEPSSFDPFFTVAEMARIAELSPQSLDAAAFRPDPESSNKYAQAPDEPWTAATELGRFLFYDNRLGRNAVSPGENNRSCASCHDPQHAFTDGGQRKLSKDVTSVLNIAAYTFHTQIGMHDSLWSMPMAPTEGSFFESNKLEVAIHLAEHYPQWYRCAFGDEDGAFAFLEQWASIVECGRPVEFGDGIDRYCQFEELGPEHQDAVNRIYANYGKAISNFMSEIATGASPFDYYAQEAFVGALTSEQKRGLRLFIGEAGCADCHSGPFLTDNEFYDIAVPGGSDSRYEGLQMLRGEGEAATQRSPFLFRLDGRYSDLTDEEKAGLPAYPEPGERERGAFRTPSLRNVAETGPYMHSAAEATLEDVVYHYTTEPESDFGASDVKFWNPALDVSQRKELVAFLNALTSLPHDYVQRDLEDDGETNYSAAPGEAPLVSETVWARPADLRIGSIQTEAGVQETDAEDPPAPGDGTLCWGS